MNPIGIDYLTLYGLHPLEFVRTAAAAGYDCVGVMLEGIKGSPGFDVHPPSLRDDPQLRRDLVSCARDNGITIGIMSGFRITDDRAASDFRNTFDLAAEMGVGRLSSASAASHGWTVQQIGALAETAADYDITITIEPIPGFTIGTLSQALALVAEIGRPNLKIMFDTMHAARTGDVDVLATADTDLIEYFQISDADLCAIDPGDYMDKAIHDRMIPGEGTIPLAAMLRHVRPDVIVSVEAPLRTLRLRGVSHQDRARLLIEGTRHVLNAALAQREMAGTPH
jgi:sugar phosphate isomerase/epimerase